MYIPIKVLEIAIISNICVLDYIIQDQSPSLCNNIAKYDREFNQ